MCKGTWMYKSTPGAVWIGIGLSPINPLKCFVGIEGNVALDRNPGLE